MANKMVRCLEPCLDLKLDCLTDASLDVRMVRGSDDWTSGPTVDLKD
jgi:hypothetical protein